MNQQTQKKLLEIVKKNYEEIADNFDITRQKSNWPEIAKLTDQVKDGDCILDVGCGNGRLVSLFSGKSIKYLGVDPSLELVEKAKSNFQSPPRSELGAKEISNFQIGNILELGKINEMNFNYVFSVAVLHHIPGQDLQIKALQQLKNKVARDGKIIITVWNLWRHKKFGKLIWKFWLLKFAGKNKMDFGDIIFSWKNSQGEKLSQRYYHAFTKRQLKKIAKKAGLKIEKLYKDRWNYYLVLKK